MKKIIMSLFVIVTVAGAAFAGTSAFFSDTETSAGNILQAGDIDLWVGNTAYYNGTLIGQDDPRGMTWEVGDIQEGEYFFNLDDLKPGDWEEDTMQIRVVSNDAYLCANVQITENEDNSITEPEDKANSTPGDSDDGTPEGDLAQELNFMFWADDGDNVLEDDEDDKIFLQGPASDVLGGGTIALVDSDENYLEAETNVLIGDKDYYIGKAFCYGTLVPEPVAQGGNNSPGDNPGFQCDGESVSNLSQTDSLGGTLSFYATQSRNNNTFQCSDELFDQAETEPVVALGGLDFEDYAGARFRSFANTGGEEVYVGENDLGVPGNRVAAEYTWGSTQPVEVSYDAAASTVSAKVGDSVDISRADGLSCDPNSLQFLIAARDAGSTVSLKNLKLDGFLLGDYSVSAGDSSEFVTWNISGFDFSQDFTLSADLELTGTFSTSQEKGKAQVDFGCTT